MAQIIDFKNPKLTFKISVTSECRVFLVSQRVGLLLNISQIHEIGSELTFKIWLRT